MGNLLILQSIHSLGLESLFHHTLHQFLEFQEDVSFVFPWILIFVIFNAILYDDFSLYAFDIVQQIEILIPTFSLYEIPLDLLYTLVSLLELR